MREIFLVILALVVVMDQCQCRSDITRPAQAYIHFQYQIQTNLFTNVAKPNIQFRASVDGMPDLPKWLLLEQRSPLHPAFLYGTPTVKDVGEVYLEIIGWNKDDYSTVKKIMRITIETKQASQVKYQMDFKISNFDLSDILLNGKYLLFTQSVQSIWSNGYLVTKIDKTVNRPGGRYTPTNVKEGVFITVASEIAPPSSLKNARYCSPQQPVAASKTVYDKFAGGEFTVDWCHLSAIELTVTASGSQASVTQQDPKYAFTKTSYQTVKYDTSRADLSSDWGYVLIPVLLGVIFITVLTIIMCCKREGSMKRDAQTPRDQLEHHRSLRRATYRMRNMNSNAPADEAPNDASYSYGRLDDDGYGHTPKQSRQGSSRNPGSSLPSTPGTNQRSTVPPPYRMPPTMPSDQASDTDSLPSGPPPYKRPEEGRW